jgi:PST family polysaccharide transporter
MEEKAIRGVSWTMLAYSGSKVLGFVSTVVVARLLLPRDFGIMALAVMATSFLSWFGDFGFSRSLVLRRDLNQRGQGTLLTLIVLSSVGATLLCAALSPLAGIVFNSPRLTPVVAVLGVTLIPAGVGAFYEGLLERELEFRRRFVAYGLQSMTSAATSIGLALAGAGVWSLVGGQLLGFVVFAVTLGALAPYQVRPRFDRPLAGDLLQTSRGFLYQGLANFLRINLDNVTVARVFGATLLGYYSMAWRFADLSWTAIAAPASRITFTAFTRAHARNEDIRPAVLSSLRVVAVAAIPFGLLLSAAAEPLTLGLLGRKWLAMVGPLWILGLWAGLRPIDSLLSWVLNAIDRAGLVSRISVSILIPLVPALILAAELGSLTTVALAVLADLLFSIATLAYFVRRELGLSFRDMWTTLRPMLLAAPATWLSTWGVGHAIGDAQPLLGLVLAMLVGISVYGASISFFDRGFLPAAGTQVMRVLGRARTQP